MGNFTRAYDFLAQIIDCGDAGNVGNQDVIVIPRR